MLHVSRWVFLFALFHLFIGCQQPSITPSSGSGGVTSVAGASTGAGGSSSTVASSAIGGSSASRGGAGTGVSTSTGGIRSTDVSNATGGIGGIDTSTSSASSGDATSTGMTSASTLSSLKVTPLGLNPEFTPSNHDYFVACSAGTNTLRVVASAIPGAMVRLLRPTTTMAASSQNQRVDLLEDQAIVLEVEASELRDQYWVRCLPHDFPLVTATSHPSEGSPTPGWYLFANESLASDESGFAMVVDRFGTPVWYRRVSTSSGVLNVDALATDSISFTPQLGPAFGTNPSGAYQILRLGATHVRYVYAVGSPTDHHELQLLPNGDALVISYAITHGIDLTGLGDYGKDSTIADCAVQQIDDQGNLVWSWLASQHFDAAKESVDPPVDNVDGEDVVDVFHCNAIDVGSDGNLLVSARHLDAVFMIDKTSGDVVWKMGGVAYNKDRAQLIHLDGDPDGGFNRQHDARLLPNGHISLFDDHSDGTASARGVEYAMDFDAGTATLVWQYQGSDASGALGSCRRYSDGHTVIGWGSNGNGLVLSEIDSDGHDVLDLSFDSGDVSYRAVKVTDAQLALDLLRQTAGLP
jgi:hypothetical protein